MSDQRRWELEARLSVDAQQAGPSVPRIGLICARFVTELAVSGAGATVLAHTDGADRGDGSFDGSVDGSVDGSRWGSRDPSRGLVHATDEASAGLEDLQLTVGEGPCLDAFESGGPVLVADLAAEASAGRWPAFTAAAVELGAAAVFSFPLQVGVVRLGSLDCYRGTPGELTTTAVTDALLLADLATQAVLAELDGRAFDDTGWLADPHTQVHQATGMVRVQLGGVAAEVALLRLRAHAFAHGQALREVARLVVTRQLRFAPEQSEGPT